MNSPWVILFEWAICFPLGSRLGPCGDFLLLFSMYEDCICLFVGMTSKWFEVEAYWRSKSCLEEAGDLNELGRLQQEDGTCYPVDELILPVQSTGARSTGVRPGPWPSACRHKPLCYGHCQPQRDPILGKLNIVSFILYMQAEQKALGEVKSV